jgi:hypothetical protein
MGALFVTTVLLTAIVLAGCGAKTAVEPPVVELAITPSGVTLGGKPVDMAQLDARLAEAQRKGERLRLRMDWRTASPSASLPYSQKQIKRRLRALQAQVLAAAARAGVTGALGVVLLAAVLLFGLACLLACRCGAWLVFIPPLVYAAVSVTCVVAVWLPTHQHLPSG